MKQYIVTINEDKEEIQITIVRDGEPLFMSRWDSENGHDYKCGELVFALREVLDVRRL